MKYNEDDLAALADRQAQENEEARLRSIARSTRARMHLAKRRGYRTDLQLERDSAEFIDESEAD